jgi:threonine dehydrogenase-like Zn-dependent dehydrogenase
MSISLLSKVKIKKSKFTGNSNNPKSKIQNPKLPNHPMIVQRRANYTLETSGNEQALNDAIACLATGGECGMVIAPH